MFYIKTTVVVYICNLLLNVHPVCLSLKSEMKDGEITVLQAQHGFVITPCETLILCDMAPIYLEDLLLLFDLLYCSPGFVRPVCESVCSSLGWVRRRMRRSRRWRRSTRGSWWSCARTCCCSTRPRWPSRRVAFTPALRCRYGKQGNVNDWPHFPFKLFK